MTKSEYKRKPSTSDYNIAFGNLFCEYTKKRYKTSAQPWGASGIKFYLLFWQNILWIFRVIHDQNSWDCCIYTENATRPLRNGISFSDFLKFLRIVVTDCQDSTGNTSVTGTNFQSTQNFHICALPLGVAKQHNWPLTVQCPLTFWAWKHHKVRPCNRQSYVVRCRCLTRA